MTNVPSSIRAVDATAAGSSGHSRFVHSGESGPSTGSRRKGGNADFVSARRDSGLGTIRTPFSSERIGRPTLLSSTRIEPDAPIWVVSGDSNTSRIRPSLRGVDPEYVSATPDVI